MEILRVLENINKDDISLTGGKGASLGEMLQAGISVPQGFVILSSAFEKFLEETDLNVEIDSILDSVNHKEIHTIENASEKIQALILNAEIPKEVVNEIQKFFKNLNSKYVAIRSSATAEDSASAAWAGQLDSFLNTTKESLLENVKKCWASLFTPRAIFYRFEKNLHKQKISVAVVVQKMVNSEKSGIAFSVHPVTQDRNQLIIEAGLGLGEAIVSGQITPDSYVVEKQPRRIIDKNVETQSRGLYRSKNGGNEWRDISQEQGEKQVLSDDEILTLSETILRIESHYNFPCDIEWAFENGQFYIVQSRPITTLTNKPIIRYFQKFFTRELSLVVMEYWHKGEYDGLHKILNKVTHFNPLFIRHEDGLVDTYYDMNNPDTAIEPMFKFFRDNPKEFDRMVKEFEILKKKLESLSDNFKFELFGNLFQTMIEAWSYLPIWVQFGSVTIEKIPKKFIDKSFNLRDRFQELEYRVGNVLSDAIKEKYPKFAKYAQVISFKEALSGQIPSLTELQNRNKGFIYFEGEILADISKEEFAQKYKLELDDNLGTVGELFLTDKLENKNNFWNKLLSIILGPKKIIFEKITRDTTYIMQEIMAYGISGGMEKEYGWKNPYFPSLINYMNQGSIEVWENNKATNWLSNTILKNNRERPEFIKEIINKYKDKMVAIHELWNQKTLQINDLERLIKLSSEAIVYYIPYYYSAMDDRTPKEIRKITREMWERDDFFAKSDVIIRDSLIIIYPKLKGYEMTIFADELLLIPDINELRKRREHFITVQGKERLLATLDEFNKIHPNFVFKKDVVKQNDYYEIKGEIAQKGKVTGKVKILRRRDQIGEVAEGDIIVSPMTTTDFLPAILKAGAIVTDEGGIICHAAITARELNKPCITGTKVATQVLKDGDMVEVDADHGIVRILK